MSSRSLRSITAYILIPLGICGLVLFMAIFISSSDLLGSHRHALAGTSERAQVEDTHASQKFACPVSLRGNSETQERRDVERRAQRMMEAHKYEEALASFRELAGMDPAFPGVNLDISMALGKLNQPAAAKQAIDSQLALSMCLAQLFPNELEPYCKAEGFASTTECIKELGSIQQGAYIQAALVQMDVEHKGKPQAGVESARVHTPDLPLVKKPVVIAAKEDGPVKPKRSVPAPSNALANGNGTDAALGAYAK